MGAQASTVLTGSADEVDGVSATGAPRRPRDWLLDCRLCVWLLDRLLDQASYWTKPAAGSADSLVLGGLPGLAVVGAPP